jgi:hypothetical protein
MSAPDEGPKAGDERGPTEAGAENLDDTTGNGEDGDDDDEDGGSEEEEEELVNPAFGISRLLLAEDGLPACPRGEGSDEEDCRKAETKRLRNNRIRIKGER